MFDNDMPTPMISATTVKPWAPIRARIINCDMRRSPLRKLCKPNDSASAVAKQPADGESLWLLFHNSSQVERTDRHERVLVDFAQESVATSFALEMVELLLQLHPIELGFFHFGRGHFVSWDNHSNQVQVI